MDEAVAGHATRIEVTLERRQPADHHRQRPRHPGRPASQISRQVGARGDPDDAPFGRQVRGQGLCDLRRPARRRRQRGQRAVERDRRRGRAQQEALPPELLQGHRDARRWRQSAPRPTAAAPRVTFTPDPEIFGADADFNPARLYKLARSKAYLFAGRRDPLALRPIARVGRRPRKAVFQFPGGLADHLARADRRAPNASPPSSSPAARTSRDGPGPRRMGGRLAALVATAATAVTATPSRRPTAAPTKRACAPR